MGSRQREAKINLFVDDAYSDFDVLFLQFFNVFDLLLERFPLLVFNRLGNQDVVVGQRCVLSDKNNPGSD